MLTDTSLPPDATRAVLTDASLPPDVARFMSGGSDVGRVGESGLPSVPAAAPGTNPSTPPIAGRCLCARMCDCACARVGVLALMCRACNSCVRVCMPCVCACVHLAIAARVLTVLMEQWHCCPRANHLHSHTCMHECTHVQHARAQTWTSLLPKGSFRGLGLSLGLQKVKTSWR